ncbi:TcdA/TcdB catalytic glycosyltransferase domain-containing protein [Photobacterium leiognathi]|uniref:TcdA/TcdB catalytic glycosyltransferase domain-containing protein n=1 Tax=Photobacterium leiognathi TaxID=553611 RepID=UPI002736D346|nr:TcdA/TcdB catalytic glycosyltransferase domain-containing protein [Photobacterium leiognathi]
MFFAVNKKIHFIWLGEPTQSQIKYIKIWHRANTDYNVFFWYDSSIFLCQEINTLFKGVTPEEHIKKRNLLYNKIKDDNVKIDDFFLSLNHKKKEALDKIKESYQVISELKKYCTIKDVRESIMTEIISSPYYFEVKFRGNLAAASDILRLIILFKYGGFYIDVDTLPIKIKSRFKPLRTITVKSNMLLLSGDMNDASYFYSNVVATHNNSMVIFECLKEINRIHSYIQKCHMDNDNDINEYRLDGIFNDSRITLRISGPGLLYNCLYSRIERTEQNTLDINKVIMEKFLFKRHCLKTPLSNISSWMLNK